jgi:CxxC-x17-CxxC domain-containing protein
MKSFTKKSKFGKKVFSKKGLHDHPGKKSFSRPVERAGGFDAADGGRERPEIFKTICGKCGKEAIVPFKPTGNKPILCKACFVKKPSFESGPGRFERNGRSNDRSERDARPAVASDQLDSINRKLDKIMRALEIE